MNVAEATKLYKKPLNVRYLSIDSANGIFN